MKPELFERRKKTVRLFFSGRPTTEGVRKIAREYGVGERAIWEDWRRREEWLDEVYSVGDLSSARERIAELDEIKREVRRDLEGADDGNINAKTGLYNTLTRVTKNQAKLTMRLKKFEKKHGIDKNDREINIKTVPVNEGNGSELGE